jgi:hypothetical protein
LPCDGDEGRAGTARQDGAEQSETKTHRLQIGAERCLKHAQDGGVGAMAAGVAVAEGRTAPRFNPQAFAAAGKSSFGCFEEICLPPPPLFLAPIFLAPILSGPDEARRR